MICLRFYDSDDREIIAPLSSVVRVFRDADGMTAVVFTDDEIVTTGAPIGGFAEALTQAGGKLLDWN